MHANKILRINQVNWMTYAVLVPIKTHTDLLALWINHKKHKNQIKINWQYLNQEIIIQISIKLNNKEISKQQTIKAKDRIIEPSIFKPI